MQGGDLLLDLSFWDGRSIALAQEIEPGRADVAFAPDPGIANIACHRTGAGVSESLPRGNSVAVYRRKCYGQIYRPGRAAAIWQRAALPVTSTVANANVQPPRSEEHTSELQSLMRISYAVFCLKQKTDKLINTNNNH